MPDLYQAIGKPAFRLIVDTPKPGHINMAIDEALMESAGIPGAPPVLRLYGFSPPVLSVGRFQKTGETFDFALLSKDRIALIRRPSGGQAVLHSRELTYCVAIGRHHFEGTAGNMGKRAVYKLIVPILVEGLKSLSVNGSPAASGTVSRDPDCFAAAGEYEIDGSSGAKLIGSAQMVSRDAVLQHGSIPLGPENREIYRYFADSRNENESTSIREELGRNVSYDEAARAFAGSATKNLGAYKSKLNTREQSRADELAAKRYGSDQWNLKY